MAVRAVLLCLHVLAALVCQFFRVQKGLVTEHLNIDRHRERLWADAAPGLVLVGRGIEAVSQNLCLWSYLFLIGIRVHFLL